MTEPNSPSPGVPAHSWGPAESAPGPARGVLLDIVLLLLPSFAAPAADMPLIDRGAVTELILTSFDGPVAALSGGRPLDSPGAPRTPVAGATFGIRWLESM